MTETDIAYSAGLFDGEGCIRIGKDKPRPWHTSSPRYFLQVLITNQNLSVLEELSKNFGGKIYRRPGCYVLFISARPSAKFLEAIKPYSRIKLPEIEVALKFQALQAENSYSRLKKSDEYLLVLDGLRQRLSDLKQVDKESFRTIITEKEIESNSEGG
jgi:LAGLIDADG endonuclease